MAIMVDAGSSGPRELHPAGLVNAVCAFVEDLGMEESTFQGKTSVKRKVVIGFETEERMNEGEMAGRRFLLSKRYTASLNEKATLRHDLASWRGRDFTPDELAGFDLESIRGVGATLNVVHYDGHDGSKRAKIANISPKYKSADKLIVELEAMPEWVLEAVAENRAAEAKRKAAQARASGQEHIEDGDDAPMDEPPLPF